MKIQIDNEVIEADKETQKIVTDSQKEASQSEKLIFEAKAKAEIEKAALLERLGLTEDELKIILG